MIQRKQELNVFLKTLDIYPQSLDDTYKHLNQKNIELCFDK